MNCKKCGNEIDDQMETCAGCIVSLLFAPVEDARLSRGNQKGPTDRLALPSVSGRMEMTHADFQHACQVELSRLQEDPNCDNALVHLLCEAVRCSRECCELAAATTKEPT